MMFWYLIGFLYLLLVGLGVFILYKKPTKPTKFNRVKFDKEMEESLKKADEIIERLEKHV
jgi:bacterioferritin (cytochrome b1)